MNLPPQGGGVLTSPGECESHKLKFETLGFRPARYYFIPDEGSRNLRAFCINDALGAVAGAR